jgi:hypothetical protein
MNAECGMTFVVKSILIESAINHVIEHDFCEFFIIFLTIHVKQARGCAADSKFEETCSFNLQIILLGVLGLNFIILNKFKSIFKYFS